MKRMTLSGQPRWWCDYCGCSDFDRQVMNLDKDPAICINCASLFADAMTAKTKRLAEERAGDPCVVAPTEAEPAKAA